MMWPQEPESQNPIQAKVNDAHDAIVQDNSGPEHPFSSQRGPSLVMVTHLSHPYQGHGYIRRTRCHTTYQEST